MINASHRDISCTRHQATSQMRTVCVALLAMAMLLPSGCVRRRLNVRSNPPGALVYVDNQQIGTTPCSVDFTYYGTREIRLVKPGYETLTVNQPIPAPWYQIPPLDFFSENLVPTKIRDNRTVIYDLAPQVIVPTRATGGSRQSVATGHAAVSGRAGRRGDADRPGWTAGGNCATWNSAAVQCAVCAADRYRAPTPSVVPQQQGAPIVSPSASLSRKRPTATSTSI